MKIVKYFFVGGFAGVVDFILFALFVKLLGFPWFSSAIVSFLIATSVNYILSILHVFESEARFSKEHEIILVFFVSAIGLIVNQIVLWIFIEGLFWNELIAKVCASCSVFLWNFSVRNFYIFKTKSPE